MGPSKLMSFEFRSPRSSALEVWKLIKFAKLYADIVRTKMLLHHEPTILCLQSVFWGLQVLGILFSMAAYLAFSLCASPNFQLGYP